MEIFSTTLWHLQREVELSALAQEMTDMDKNSPEVRIRISKTDMFSLYKHVLKLK